MEYVAKGPNELWSWDITYLRGPVRGQFLYLYLVVDVWSRMIVAWEVAEEESGEIASQMIVRACRERGVDSNRLVVHSDNGGPMKGATLLATFQVLGIVPSFSRPRVSDDNPYSACNPNVRITLVMLRILLSSGF
jgi:putative transposase